MNSFTILSGRFQQAIGPNHIPWPDRRHHRNHFSRAAIRWPTALAVIVVRAAKHPSDQLPLKKTANTTKAMVAAAEMPWMTMTGRGKCRSGGTVTMWDSGEFGAA